jgi:hypothetical protein
VIATAFLIHLLLQGVPFVQPGGVSGQLRTIDGLPAVAVRVVAMPVPTGTVVPDDGPNYFILAPATGVALTDNEGKYRFMDLAPGRYYLMAGVAGQATYYPKAEHLNNAAIVDVVSGVLAEDYDFALLHRLGGKLTGRVVADLRTLGQRTATITGGKLEDILEVPVRPDGSFEFGHVPPGKYLVSLYPPTPGIASYPVTVGDADVSGVTLVPLPTQTVTGKLVVKNGPMPVGILGFYTDKTYVGGTINPDGTFTVQLHGARHEVDLAGLPVGYSLDTVRVGSREVKDGIVVDERDVSNVVISVNAPQRLAQVRGRITGLPATRLGSTTVELTGPIVGKLRSEVQPDGSFDFPVVTPGLYRLTLSEVPDLAPMTLVIDSPRVFEVPVVVPNR